MEIKDKVFWAVIGMLVLSLIVNIFLVKYRIEVNFISNGASVEQRSKVVKSTSESKPLIKKLFSSSSRGGNFSDFDNDFENGKTAGWKGKVTSEKAKPGSKYSLEIPRGGNRYFAADSMKEFTKDRLEATAGTEISFDYYMEEGSFLKLQMYCPKKKDNYNIDIKNPTLGEWDTVTVGLGAFQDNSHRGMSPESGDEFSNIQIYAGNPGENTYLLIDNFKISN